MAHTDHNTAEPSVNEGIKNNSNYLRGTIVEGLDDYVTGAVSEQDLQLLKFHGIYQQDDRDIRAERRQQKLEPAFSFMIRARVPGGVFNANQWLMFDKLASDYGEENFRLTTRQAFQLHGVIKKQLKHTIQDINKALFDTIAACGDVNRNVMCSIAPHKGQVFDECIQVAKDISRHLTPHTPAYHEIWLDGQKIVNTDDQDVEPLYGKTYLPRKFKIGIAIPPSNDIEVHSQDIGLVAVVDDGKLTAFNVIAGGGMGTTHGDTTTYPLLGQILGSCKPEQAVDVAEKLVSIQRDYGNRSNRKRARFKYTIEERGLDWLLEELTQRLGYELADAYTVTLDSSGDQFGWQPDEYNDHHHLTVFVPQGRIVDDGTYNIRSALKEIAEIHQGDMILTPNQNLTITDITPTNKPRIEAILDEHKILTGKTISQSYQRAMACVAMPTCGLAMAEAERYLPDFVARFDQLLDQYGLSNEMVSLRITGCPNGCARPFLGEVALVGKGTGVYNCYLGGSHRGDRLNRLYLESANETQIFQALEPIIQDYAESREQQEHFGDFVIRKNYITEVKHGSNFHGN